MKPLFCVLKLEMRAGQTLGEGFYAILAGVALVWGGDSDSGRRAHLS